MNRILKEDNEACEHMIIHGETSNEKKFFSEMLSKETSEISLSGDLLMSEHDNDCGIYILREGYDEFRTGVASASPEYPEVYADGISALLAVTFKDIGLNDDKTIGEWLREIDYKGVNYKSNYDLQ